MIGRGVGKVRIKQSRFNDLNQRRRSDLKPLKTVSRVTPLGFTPLKRGVNENRYFIVAACDGARKVLVFTVQSRQAGCMRRRYGIWISAILLAAGTGVLWLVLNSSNSEPVYKGRRLSAWLEDATEFTDVDTQRQAVEAIKAIGTNGLPSLIRMMRSKDSQFKLGLIELSRKQQFVKFQPELASSVHQRAAYGCAILRSEARPAISTLMDLLQVQHDDTMVAGALVRIGPDGVLALTGGLTNKSADVRYCITAALAHIGIWRSSTNNTPEQIATLNQEADIAVPALMKLLSNKSDPARGQAATTLGVIGFHADIVVPALIETLQDANTAEDGLSTAISAARALGRFGHEAEGSIPALVIALKSPSAGLQDAATKSLKEINPEAAAKAGVQ